MADRELTRMALNALQYVVNTNGNATVAIFDDDHDPIGPSLRAELMPAFVAEVNGRLRLTPAGEEALEGRDG